MKQRFDEISKKAADAGQAHIFKFWRHLDESSRENLLSQAETIDWRLLTKLKQKLASEKKPAENDAAFEPAEAIPVPVREDEKRAADAVRVIGERALSTGKVGAILVAGGQGSRLGYDGPKGMFEIGPVSGKTLFQLHAEKLLALRRRYGKRIPWYIMTSEVNNRETLAFFKENSFFGLPPEDVFIFKQGMMPALDENGKLILDAPGRIFMSPNGHGGIFKGLLESGACRHMRDAGLEHLFYFQVDNVLINMCDALFLGYHIERQSDMSSKVVRKRDPEEKMGVIGKVGGRLSVIEYSDLSKEDMYARDERGRLVFNAGSIAVHVLERKFIESIAGADFELPWHVAHKKIPFIDEAGDLLQPESANGYKFETFIFDALGFAKNGVVLEVEREKEFSAVKNATGADSPETARRDLSNYYATWLAKAGFTVAENTKIEINPGYARNEGEFLKRLKERVIKGSFSIG